MNCLSRYFWIVAIGIIISSPAQAALSVDASPVEGGNSLRFGRIQSDYEVNKEVRLRISSTDGDAYQVFQRLAEPLTNEKGQRLDYDSIKTYTISGSNGSGTLYQQNIDYLDSGDQLIYSSASNGVSDNLTIVYSIDNDSLNASGQFFGKIQYIVRAIGASGRADVFLNVFAENTGHFKAEVHTQNMSDVIEIDSNDPSRLQSSAFIHFEGNYGQTIKVYQEIETYPQGIDFYELERGSIIYQASGADNGELKAQAETELDQRRVEIYESDADEDRFQINLSLNEDIKSKLKAGEFKGRLRYIIEVDGEEQLFPLELNVRVSPVFHIDAEFPSEGMRFDNLVPNAPPQVKEILVNVNSNLGKPYMVLQNISSPVTSQKGDIINPDFFHVKQELLKGYSGKVVDQIFKSVAEGQHPIYYSDAQGSPAQFKVQYRLKAFPGMEPGDYSTSITYSLGEM